MNASTLNQRSAFAASSVLVERLEGRRLLADMTSASIDFVTAGTDASTNNPVPNGAADLTVYAGQGVHVDALSSTLAAGDELGAQWEWDFGDPGSGNGAGPGVGGTSGNKNEMRGWIAAHVYDQPNTSSSDHYTITLRVTATDGSSEMATATVHVKANDADGRRTIYVNNTGNHQDADLDSVTFTMEELPSAIQSNTIIRFERGGVYDVDNGTKAINLTALDDVTFTSYGTHTDKPYLRWNVDENTNLDGYQTPFLTSWDTSDIVFDDLKLGADMHAAVSRRWAMVKPGGVNTVVRNCEYTFVSTLIQPQNRDASRGVLLLDNTYADVSGEAGNYAGAANLGRYFLWNNGQNVTVLGNKALNSVYEHVVRGIGYSRTLVSANVFQNDDSVGAGTDVTDYSKSSIHMQVPHREIGGGFEAYAYVVGNHLSKGDAVFGPLGEGDGNGGFTLASDRAQYAIFERNLVEDAKLTLEHGARHAVLRNNVVLGEQIKIEAFVGTDTYSNGHGGHTTITYNRGVEDVRVLFNTVSVAADDAQAGVSVGGGPTGERWGGHTIVGNLTTGSATSGLAVPSNLGQAFVEVGDNVLDNDVHAVTISNNQHPTTATEWEQQLSAAGVSVSRDLFASVPIGADFEPTETAEVAMPRPTVVEDYYGSTRPSQGPWTSGAVERNAGGGSNNTVDLHSVFLDVDPNPETDMVAGGPIDYQFEIRNSGTSGSGDFDVGFYLSKNATISAADRLLRTVRVSGVAAGSSSQQYDFSTSLPTSGDSLYDGDGTYYVGIIVDVNADVAEVDEGNNRNQGDRIDVEDVGISGTGGGTGITTRFDFENAYANGDTYGVGLGSDGNYITDFGDDSWVKVGGIDFSDATDIELRARVKYSGTYKFSLTTSITDPYANGNVFAEFDTYLTQGSSGSLTFDNLSANIVGALPSAGDDVWLVSSGGATPDDLADLNWLKVIS